MSQAAAEPSKESIARKIVMFPLVRIIVAIGFIVATVFLLSAIINPFEEMFFADGKKPVIWLVTKWTVCSILITLAYIAYVRLVERRELSELAPKAALSEFTVGYLIGGALMCSSVFMMWMLGLYRVEAVGHLSVLIPPFFAMIFVGFIEEIVFRGILFRVLHESLGTWIAIVVSSILFGFAHAINPNATILSSSMLALEAGLLFSAFYLLTNRLWMVIGVHAGFNFLQGTVFGINVSGNTANGLFISKLEGPDILTGGAFGAEGSIITILICLFTSGLLLLLAYRKGHFRTPFWRRSTTRHTVTGATTLNATSSLA